MAGKIWFGTRGYGTWVPAPAVNVDASKVGWTSQTNYLSGGAFVRNSLTAHKEFSFAWNLASREDIRLITDFADGLYGDGPFYWGDPFVMDANMLPQSVAAPFLGAKDGPILGGGDRPTLIGTSANSLGYPVQSAVYTIGTGDKPSVWVPIPPGYKAWVGAHGLEGTGGKVVVTPTTGATTTGTPVNLTMLSVTDKTRVNASFGGGVGNTTTGILVSLGGTGTVTLAGIIVQVLPQGAVPATGGFISGQGHSGCAFASQPVLTQYNAVIDKVGLTAKLVEVGLWL